MDEQSFVIYGPTLLKQPVTAVCSELSVVVCITHAIFARAVQLCSFCPVAALPCIRDLRAVSSERADSSSGADSNESLVLGFLFAFALAFAFAVFAPAFAFSVAFVVLIVFVLCSSGEYS